MEKIALFDCVEVDSETTKGKPKKISVCPHCHERGRDEEISSRDEKFGSSPVLVSYVCENGCKPARDERRHNDADKKKRDYFEKYDLRKIHEIEAKVIPYWYPRDRMMHVASNSGPWGAEWRPGRDFRTVADLFTKRNLWALATIFEGIKGLAAQYRDVLKFTASSFLLNLSKLYKHREGGGGQPTGNYYIPQINRENEAWASFSRKYKDVLDAHTQLPNALSSTAVFISTESAERINRVPSNSIDLVFTDPPYAGKYQYGELNFIWESWLQLDTHWHKDEITINEFRGKTEADWANMMRSALAECYRVLKPGRWLSLCYHDTAEGTWALVQDIMTESGFLPDTGNEAVFIDTGQKTYNQSQADKVNKRDLVINFRKPKPGEVTATLSITGSEDNRTFNEKVHSIIREYLGDNPGATKDRIYDEVVSHMVRAGRMEAHDFEGLLRQVAEEVKEPVKKTLYENEDPNIFGTHEISRWYLKETEFAEADAAESAKEDDAAEKVEKFIEKKLKEHPEFEGVHYSDIFEHYIYSVKDKPRRPLAEWLLDYFFKTDTGTYRLAQSDEEKKLKAEGRAKGTHRRVKRFIAYLQQGVAIPAKEQPNDATLAEWLRYCKRSGLYEQGNPVGGDVTWKVEGC